MKYIAKICLILLPMALFTGCTSTDKDQYKNLDESQLFNRGKIHVDEKKYAVAVKDFEALQSRYPYGGYTEKAQLSLIYAYFKKGDHPSALATINHFLDLHPQNTYADYAMYMKGLVLYEQYYSFIYRYFPIDRSERDSGSAKKSFHAFKELLESFPNSSYALDAKQRMLQLKNQLASHELGIAKFYMRKQAYLAAASRAGNIITEYRGSDVTPDALSTMASAYNKLGMNQLEKNALIALKNSYPQYKDK